MTRSTCRTLKEPTCTNENNFFIFYKNFIYRYVLFNETNSKITHLTYYLGWLYWLDRDIEQMQRLEPYSGNSRSVVLNHASHIVDLIAVVQPSSKNPCAHTKHCSHLCILNGTNPVCACLKGKRKHFILNFY